MQNEEHVAAAAETFSVVDLPESEVELKGDIPYETLSLYEARALKKLTEEVQLPGFRKGHVPPELVRQKVGELHVLEEAVELCMRDLYPALLVKHQLDVVGQPEIKITKLAPKNSASITIVASVYPQVELPKDWKDVSKNIPLGDLPIVSQQEIVDALESIRRAHTKAQERSVASPETDCLVTTVPAEESLPPLDDAFAQSLGPFTDLADLRAKMRENLEQEKEQKTKDTRRGKIIESLLEKTTLAVPSVFVDSELEKMLGQMREDVSRYNISFEEYLKQVNKTEEAIRSEFRDQARKRAKLQLILNKIAADEKIEADRDMVEQEFGHAIEHFPDARPDLLRIHIETILRNEKAFQLLEKSV